MREDKPSERRGETNDRFDFDPKKEAEMEGGYAKSSLKNKAKSREKPKKLNIHTNLFDRPC